MGTPLFMKFWQKRQRRIAAEHGEEEGKSASEARGVVLSVKFLASYPGFYQVMADNPPLVVEETRVSSGC